MKFCNTFYIVNKSEIKKSTNENVTKNSIIMSVFDYKQNTDNWDSPVVYHQIFGVHFIKLKHKLKHRLFTNVLKFLNEKKTSTKIL